MTSAPLKIRFIFIALAGISLLTALWSGLARMGWDLPVPNRDFVSLHGPLMAIGFLGTLIGLERAAAVERWWVYGIPLFSVVTIGALLADAPLPVITLPAIIAAFLLTVFFAALYRRQPAEHFVVMTLSAVALCVGNIIWFAEAPLSQVVPWWAGYLVLMIAGERLELTRMRRPPLSVRVLFRICVAIVLAGLTISIYPFYVGVRIAGAGLFLLALWLLRYDLAWQNLSQPGLPRFMARCLIAGYVWLAVGGALWIIFAKFFAAGPVYDAMLHTIFLGFVFSMIFAHGPIILPVITGMKLPFQNLFYLHAVILHAGLILRLAGDLSDSSWAQKSGGALNTLAILLFLFNNLRAVKLANRATSP
jgi:hypothetical protein